MSRQTPEDHFRPNGCVSPWSQQHLYARRAIYEALECGLTAEELDGVLGKLDPTSCRPIATRACRSTVAAPPAKSWFVIS